jgi:hypothetical protein
MTVKPCCERNMYEASDHGQILFFLHGQKDRFPETWILSMQTG